MGLLDTMKGVLTQYASGTASPAKRRSTPSSDIIRSIAQRVEQSNPGAIDKMSSFYAQHPTLVKTLGSAAMMIAMRKIAERHAQNA
ncbi:MAG TPA: hypothetical protein VGY48_12335 [Vicinamibacterales bacterium]|jgi:hypothetical protein|nr:hypothetical protein [Vicinamibacterales bacterium]